MPWLRSSKFSGDAAFHDCRDVEQLLGGGSDDAGFVQVIQGRTRDVELIAAGSLFMVVPVIVFYLLFQRQFIQGMTAGAVKG